jgi:hypothetical protein
MTADKTFSRPFLIRYRRAYNALSDVDDAHARLRRNRRHRGTIRKVLRVIRQHRANGYLGVTLLHRHFEAGSGDVFVERHYTPRVRDHARVLVTCPIPAPRAPVRLAPHRFTFTPAGTLQPLEFTTDAAAIRAHARLAGDTQLQADIAEVIGESGLESLLGVGIYVRDASVAKATSVFLEETLVNERRSVVHVLPRMAIAARRVVPTLWASGLDGDLVCEQLCQAYCSHGPFLLPYCGHGKGRHVGKT